jgi:hypothetical protein
MMRPLPASEKSVDALAKVDHARLLRPAKRALISAVVHRRADDDRSVSRNRRGGGPGIARQLAKNG